MKLACSNLIFGRLPTEESFLRCLSIISAAGYAGTQIEYDKLPVSLRRHPEKVKRAASDSGLELVAVAVTLDPKSVRFTSEVESTVGTLCLFERDSKKALAGTIRLARQASKLGVNVALHPHVKSNIQSLSDIDRFFEACKTNPSDRNFPSLVFDTAHFTSLGIDMANYAKRYRDRISIAHLKDLRELGPPDRLDYERDFLDIGDGIVDFKSALSVLSSIGYDGWLVVEIDHPHGGGVEGSVRKNYERISNLLTTSAL